MTEEEEKLGPDGKPGFPSLEEQLKFLESEALRLQAEADEIEDTILPLKKQVMEARALAFTRRKYADTAWFVKTNADINAGESDIRRLNRRANLMQMKAKDIKKTLGGNRKPLSETDRHKTFHREFVLVAQEILPHDQYLRLCQIAEGRMKPQDEVQPEARE